MTAELSEYHQKSSTTIPEETVLGYMCQANNRDPEKISFHDLLAYAIRMDIKNEVFWAIRENEEMKLLEE